MYTTETVCLMKRIVATLVSPQKKYGNNIIVYVNSLFKHNAPANLTDMFYLSTVDVAW